MITQAQLDKIMKKSATKSRISGGYRKMNASNSFIKKFKLAAGSTQTLIVPLHLAVPFNPMDPDDETYSTSNPFFIESSVETAWSFLRELAKENKKVQDAVTSMIGEEVTDKHWEMTGKDLAHLLKPYRTINAKGDYTIKVNIPAISEYEQRYAIDSVTDADGITRYEGLLYRLSCLEQEFIKPQMKELNEKFKEGGELAHYSKKQKSTERQKIAAQACISRPSFFPVIRVLVIETSNDEPTKDVVNALKREPLSTLEYWTALSREKIEGFTSKLGGKYDCNPSYVEYKISAGNDDPLTRYSNANKSVAEADQVKAYIEDFEKKYQEYRNDLDLQDDKVLIKSIRDLQKIEDNILLEAYQTNLANYDRSVFREEIVDAYIDTIREVNADLADELEKAAIKGKLNKQTIADDEITEFLEDREDEEDEDFTEEDKAAVRVDETPAAAPAQPAVDPSLMQTAFGGMDFSAQGIGNPQPDFNFSK